MSDNTHAISVTLKGKGAYDPWIVIYADNPVQSRERVEAVSSSGLIEAVAAAAKKYGDAAPTTYKSEDNATQPATQSSGGGWGNSGGNSAPASNNNSSGGGQRQYPEDPGRPDGPAPECEHGPKEWRNPPNKDWKGWFCREKKRSGSCAAQWVS